MFGYAANYTVYTMAMIGLICFAMFVYKKFFLNANFNNKSQFLGIEESISLAPRKNLHVIRAGKEKFLIACDVDKTTLISKLNENSTKKELTEELPVIVDFQKKNVLKDMVKKINEI